MLDQGPFFHGTKAELQIGDLLQTQRISNYQNRKMNHIYFTGALDTAKWGAELSATLADEPAQEYIYIIEQYLRFHLRISVFILKIIFDFLIQTLFNY